jgi:hypothetical protein
MAPYSPIIAFGFGESNPYCLHYPGCYAGYLPTNSTCDSLSCPTQRELVESNNILTFQQDYTAFSGPHFACLAISTHRSSSTSPAIQTLDPQREILYKTTRSSKILHRTALKLQFSLTTSPTPIFQRKMTLPTKIPHKMTKSAPKLVPNNKFPIAKLRVPTTLKKVSYYPEPNQISRFHHKTRPKPALRE